jgi:hypothetical protein
VSLGEIEVRDQHLLLLKTWEQPDGHQLEVFAIALTVEKSPPEWRP